MQQKDTPRDLARQLADIEQLDLAPIRFKIGCKEDGYGWTEEHAERIEKAYRRFLMLVAKYPDRQLAPTRDIDKFWHAHILDTRKYAADCQRIFGTFIHHYPYLGLRGDLHVLNAANTDLRQLFTSEFGEAVPADAAWCGVEPSKKEAAAAWCGVEPSKKEGAAAWCGVEPSQQEATAAWCGVEPSKQQAAAAWCGVEPSRQQAGAAWCGVEPTQEQAPAAWCGVERAQQEAAAAWCGVEPGRPSDAAPAAWCGVEPQAASHH